jgi:hypothetical protein
MTEFDTQLELYASAEAYHDYYDALIDTIREQHYNPDVYYDSDHFWSQFD